MNIKDLIEEIGLTPKRKAACHGGEYSSPCPFCEEGDDRFIIHPNRQNKNGEYQGGRFSCRVCGKYGDAISFLRLLYGLGYKEACLRLKIEPKKQNTPRTSRAVIKLPIVNDPPELWQEKAKYFVEWCSEQLFSNPAALTIITNRGFTLEAIKRFKIGFNPKDFFRKREDWGLPSESKDNGKERKLWLPSGFVIPTFSSEGNVIKAKIRRQSWKEGDKLPKYAEISGSKQTLSVYGNTSLATAIVLESELDSLLIQQFVGDLVYCIALGGSTKPLDLHTDQLLRRGQIILFCPDFDKAGAVAWARWKNMFPNIQRILTPDGKAPGDAYIAGVDLREWILETLKSNKRSLTSI